MNPQSAAIAGSENPLKSRFESEIRAKIFSKSADPFAYSPAQETGFLPGLKFSTTTNERASISRAILEIEANAVIYIHTSKISNDASFGHRQPRQARTRPELVCCEAW